ncbi:MULTISPECIES: hypothetical protein [unclassified Micromonospora]|uniref:hypothetical protein n=1 Tax=unclassified Micromonospora TaxID=2617518 RepID=UPI001C2387AA|nr:MULTISPECIES: hypothetical protein [unclassified Micromonospora]MBU8858577.1 hypothetical protein [Micromonospora sp. WMMB482]MDM4784220.1 hypothetical protein [Micromonospora sp. b486]
MDDSPRRYRPAPDLLLLTGSATALVGYLIPWFRASRVHQWWYSGWNYLETEGGWTWLVVVSLVIAVLAGLWAGRSTAFARLAVGAAVAGMFLAGAVVAVSLGALPERSSINWVGELPFGMGLPLMAVGFGAVVAGALGTVRRPAEG